MSTTRNGDVQGRTYPGVGHDLPRELWPSSTDAVAVKAG
jgi:hypothetical protein